MLKILGTIAIAVILWWAFLKCFFFAIRLLCGFGDVVIRKLDLNTPEGATFLNKHQIVGRTAIITLGMLFFFFLFRIFGGVSEARLGIVIGSVLVVILMLLPGLAYLFDSESKYRNGVTAGWSTRPFRLRLCHCALSVLILAAGFFLMLAFVGFSLDLS